MPVAANNAAIPPIAAGSQCVAGNVDNCRVYSANSACDVCGLGFTQSAGACSPVIPLCKVFNTLTSCRRCSDTTMQSLDFGSCMPGTIANCVTYSSNLKCLVC